jgi:hypothetical protein
VGVVPDALRGVFLAWAAGFGETVFPKFVTLLLGSVLMTGRRTVSRLLSVVGELADADPSSYHRVLSMRRWSMWSLARPLVKAILDTFLPQGVVYLAGDETVTEHPGRKVFGKGRHRDAKRSSHSFVAHLWGHKWVVLAILVKLPGIERPWALPVLVALYRNEKDNKAAGRRHQTPSDLMRQLLCVLLRWFPTRQFVFAGDGGYANHMLTRFARRHEKRLTLVSRFYADAALYAAPPRPKKGAKGRPRVKGKKLPSPQDVVKRTKKRKRLTVNWYGGQSRRVEVVTGTGHWYKSGEGLVEVLWLFVHDLTGTHRDEYFFTTDVTQTAKQVIETFTGRWSIEVTFQEVRAYLGVETTRGWIERTVLRAEPCLFCLYSIVALWYAALPERDRQNLEPTWTGKTTVTFSDAITLVRRDLWSRWIFATPAFKLVMQKLTHNQKRQLTRTLTLAT